MVDGFKYLLACKKMTTENAKHELATALTTPGEQTCWAKMPSQADNDSRCECSSVVVLLIPAS